MRDDESRKDAIALLGEMYWNDEEWGQEPRIKQCILDILMQLSQVAGNGTKGKHAIHDVQHLSMLSDLFNCYSQPSFHCRMFLSQAQ